jgi:hypothetical protein
MYYLSECLIIKDENQYLIEHLQHGVQSGIEHFYIYDNYSDVPVSEFLKDNYPEVLDRCTIELYKHDGQLQIECYRHFLDQHRNDTKWCAFIDTDEMLEGDLTKLCKENEDYITLRIQQIMHGNNGHAYKPESGTLTELYQPHVLTKKQMAKIVAQVKYVETQKPHHSEFNKLGKDQFDVKYWMKYVQINETCQLHHYFFRSFEEWLQKILRGNVLPFVGFGVKDFFVENTISDEDRDALLEKYGMTMSQRQVWDGYVADSETSTK